MPLLQNNQPVPRWVAILFFIVISSGFANLVEARTIHWAQRNWLVKTGTQIGPGPNNFSDSTNNVWVDTNDFLHLKITRVGGTWYCAEVISEESFGHGDYRFKITTDYDKFDTNVVGGMFTYFDDDNEIDIEFTRAWTGTNNICYTTQPATNAGNTNFFYMKFTEGTYSTHRFTWLTNSIFFQSYFGHSDPPPSNNLIFGQWLYTGSSIPPDSSEQVHLNMWLFKGRTPLETQHLELVFSDFKYVPVAGSQTVVNALFWDDFADGNYWDKWQAVNDPTYSSQIMECLRVQSSNYEHDQSGIASLNKIQWSSSSGCVFQTVLDAIQVTQTNIFDRIDVKTVMSAMSDGRFRGTVYFATNAATLLGSYLGSSNLFILSFLTKTNAPNSMGSERFTGYITNFSSYLSEGNITLGFRIDSNRFQILAHNALGTDIPIVSTLSNNIGYHDLGPAFTSIYWSVGVQNWTNGRAYVFYDSTQISYTNRIISPFDDMTVIVSNTSTIGKGEDRNHNPVDTYYRQERLQALYLASEVRYTGTIMALALDVQAIPVITLSNYTIRAQHTTLTSMPDYWVSNGWTILYQASTTIAHTGWFDFAPSNLFVYNGTNNLLLDFSRQNDDYGNAGAVLCSPAPTPRIYEQSVDDGGDPLTWTGQNPLRSGTPPTLRSNYPNLRLTFSSDGDCDALPDQWEIQYFSSLTNMCGSSDTDNDRFIDYAEYAAGTNPTNANSMLNLAAVSTANSTNLTVQWSSVAGKTYVVERSLNLMNPFSNLASRTATPPMNTYTDTTATGTGPFIYRIRLP
jgi:hypothetical protein